MDNLNDASNLREFFELMQASERNVYIRFHGLEKASVEGKVVKVAEDFVQISHRYAQYICPYRAIRLVVLR